MSKRFTVTMISSAIALFASVASASDGKIYPGEMCSFESNSTGWSKSGHFKNTSGSNLSTYCPVVRDYEANSGIDYASLVIGGTNPSGIYIVVRNKFAGSVASYPGAIASGGWWQWSPDSSTYIPTADLVSYRFELKLPANSSIQYYRLDEVN
jgi:hypothetical protein